MLFETYKTYWSAQFTKMVRVVIEMYEKYNPEADIGEYTVQVSTDTLSINDLPQIATSVGNLMSNALGPLIPLGIVPTQAAKEIVRSFWHIILQSAGVTNADAITSAEAFEVGKETVVTTPAEPEPAEEGRVDASVSTWTHAGRYVDGVDILGGNGADRDALEYAAIVREMVNDAIGKE